jgi:hypothetical protein
VVLDEFSVGDNPEHVWRHKWKLKIHVDKLCQVILLLIVRDDIFMMKLKMIRVY